MAAKGKAAAEKQQETTETNMHKDSGEKNVEPEEKVTEQKEDMKNNNPEQEDANPKSDEEGKGRKRKEPEYLATELTEHSYRLFGVKKECVVAALQAEKVTSCTISRAKDIVQKFMKKEVK